MTTREKVISIIVLLLIVGGGVAALWWGASIIIEQFSQLDRTIATVSVLAMICVVTSAFIIANGFVRAKDREHKFLRQMERFAVYKRALNTQNLLVDRKLANKRAIEEQCDMELELILKAGPDVVAWYAEMSLGCDNNGEVDPKVRLQLIMTMRKDLGLPNSGMSGVDLERVG